LASGITNAEAAEAEVSSDYEHAQSLMNKALYCFRQANNDLFARKAEIQLESFGLRIKIFKANREGTLLEKDGAGYRLELETEAVDSMERRLIFSSSITNDLDGTTMGSALMAWLQPIHRSVGTFWMLLSFFVEFLS
jgi:hypothetical protein